VGYKSAMSSSSATIAAIHAQMMMRIGTPMMRIGTPMIRYGIKLDAVASTLLTERFAEAGYANNRVATALMAGRIFDKFLITRSFC
jgi:hypothetical protein